MKKMTVEMPEIGTCLVTQCAYNSNQNCHAKAITIGDDRVPACDTFFAGVAHTKATTRIAGVGACKVTGCRYNQDMECSADSIAVGSAGNQIHCLTYSPKQQQSSAA